VATRVYMKHILESLHETRNTGSTVE